MCLIAKCELKNEVNNNPFNDDSKNIFFLRETLISGEGWPENLEKMGNNRDIYCYANRGW